MPATSQFDNPLSTEEVYRLICTMSAFEDGRDAISARVWINHSSWYNDRMTLTDGSYIARGFMGEFYRSNVTLSDILSERT